MVLTISVVGGDAQPAAGQDNQTIISPNDLAQIMSGQSGQTLAGFLNPDGTITLNSNFISTQQLGGGSNATPPMSTIPVTNLQQQQQQLNGLSPLSPLPTATASSPGAFHYHGTTGGARGTIIKQEQQIDPPANSISNLQALNPNDLGNMNHGQMSALNFNQLSQQQQQPQQSSTTQKKGGGQKRLTAKQRQALQQQQQLQHTESMQQQQSAQLDSRQQQIMTPNNSINGSNIVGQHQQQPQVVATVQLPNGQIGQLIAPQGGFWSPNALNLQQLSMAVAAATGTMPQPISMPVEQSELISGGQQTQQMSPQMHVTTNNITQANNLYQQQQHEQQQPQQNLVTTNSSGNMSTNQHNNNNDNNSNNNNFINQQQVMTTVQLPNNQLAQVIGRPSQMSQIWSGGPISFSQLTALAQQGIIQIAPIQDQTILTPTSAGSITSSQAAMMNSPSTQPSMQNPILRDPDQSANNKSRQSNASSQQQRSRQSTSSSTNNSLNSRSTKATSNRKQGTTTSSTNNIIHHTTESGSSQSSSQRKLKRLACTCPNCRDSDRSGGAGGPGYDKRKQHICHFPDCHKVYGKTSHLRAHLRWHSGERPYECSWTTCGKKFTRSDELQRHRRTHTGEKRFQCQECLKRFMRSDHLSKHLKTHLSSKKCGGGGGGSSTIAQQQQTQMALEQQQKQLGVGGPHLQNQQSGESPMGIGTPDDSSMGFENTMIGMGDSAPYDGNGGHGLALSSMISQEPDIELQ